MTLHLSKDVLANFYDLSPPGCHADADRSANAGN
jgi:hypothetical protein